MAAMVAVMVLVPVIMNKDKGAGIVFGVTTVWMLANFLVWTVIMRCALVPKSEESNTLALFGALGAKLVLLASGIIALRVYAPYTKTELLGLVAGISSVLLIAFLRALSAKIVQSRARADEKKRAEAQV